MLNPAHIDDVAHIEDDDYLFKMGSDKVEHFNFFIVKKITAVCKVAISVLAR